MNLPKRPLKKLPKDLEPLALDSTPMPPLARTKWYLEGPWYGKRGWAAMSGTNEPAITHTLSTALPFNERWEAESFKCRSRIYDGFLPMQRGVE